MSIWRIFEITLVAVFLPITQFFSFSARSVETDSLSPVKQQEIFVPSAPQETKTVPPSSLSSGITSSAMSKSAVPKLHADALKQCLAKPASQINPCFDAIFRPYLESHSTAQALRAVEELGDTDPGLRISCHPVIHSIGRETFLRFKTVHDSFAACDQTCHSGCYHGAMERFLRGDAAAEKTQHLTRQELTQKAASACDPKEATRFRFQCLHGLGHALMYFLDYKLRDTLASCDVQPDGWARSSCYGGVFMENVFSATPEKRDLRAADYHYPCSTLDPKYRSDCYMMQTTRMSEMGLSAERLFEECRKAGDYRFTCFQSIGRDLSNDVRIGQGAGVAKKCELGKEDPEREACIRGAIYALIDNTWDGKYALPFCGLFSTQELRDYCSSASAEYIRSTYQ